MTVCKMHNLTDLVLMSTPLSAAILIISFFPMFGTPMYGSLKDIKI